MKQLFKYLDYIKEKGKTLNEINPGSDEYALTVNDTLYILDFLSDDQIPILGGDILSEKDNGELIYAYQLWGEKYHCLSWYCDKKINESRENYIKRSHIIAKNSIKKANDVSIRLGKKCYIVLVI